MYIYTTQYVQFTSTPAPSHRVSRKTHNMVKPNVRSQKLASPNPTPEVDQQGRPQGAERPHTRPSLLIPPSNSEVSNSQLVRPLLQCGGKGFFKNKNSLKKHFHCMATLCHKNIGPKVIKLIFKFMYLYSHAYSSVCLLLLQNKQKSLEIMHFLYIASMVMLLPKEALSQR